MEHVRVDCETGEVTTVPLTKKELAAQARAQKAAELRAADVEEAAAAAQDNAETLRAQAEEALATNRDWLNNGPFTPEAAVDQVKSLVEQQNGVLRLLLRKFDGTD